MTKKGKRLAMDMTPGSGLSFPVADEAKTRRRFEILLEDYQDLLKENEAKKRKLEKTKEKKLRLLAEVKFLRKKYKSLSKNPSGKKMYRLKKRSDELRNLVSRPQNETFQFFHAGQSSNSAPQSEVGMNNHIPPVRESAFPSTSTVIDLNQNAEDMEEFQLSYEPLKTDKMKYSAKGETTANDLQFPICRDVGNGASRVPKRKITWQDQVALKV